MDAASSRAAPGARPRWELADLVRLYGEQYRREHPVPPAHAKVLHDIEVCRTSYLGGHMEQCDRCGFHRPAYNSCRNRHCPKCQALAKARWLQNRRGELLPVGYFHTVFTVPHELNALALGNKRIVYDILFHSAGRTLCAFGAAPRHGLGGKLGFTAVLHTWDQQMRAHVHLHCLVAGGALCDDGTRWTAARKGFLFPVRALSKVFRGKFLASLQRAFDKGELAFRGKASPLACAQAFARLVASLRARPWVVYAKKPFAGPELVLDYLSRYTHRIAISNERILDIRDGKVRFAYRDRSDGDKRKAATLEAGEFIRRFLLHVLPGRYVRIRHFGFLASRSKAKDLARCRVLLGQDPPPPSPPQLTARELLLDLTGCDIALCPQCHEGTMRVVADLNPHYTRTHPPAYPRPPDTS